MGFKDAMRTARRTDTLPASSDVPQDVTVSGEGQALPVSAVEDPEMTGRLPKRSASFGRSFGGIQAITTGITRKSTGDGTKTPPGGQSSAATTTNGTMGPPNVPESSHLAQFSLKLSELINKAFMPCTGSSSTHGSSSSLAGVAKAAAMTAAVASTGVPSLSSVAYDGRKLPSKAVVSELALLIVAELEYAASVDPYLLRAVSRQALKALTPFADRMDSLVVQPSKDATATQMPTTIKEAAHLSSALEYNLGLVTIEYIVEDALERCIEGPPDSLDEGMPPFVSEILTPVRKKMESTILHVIQPILNSAKASLMATISKAVLAPFAGYGQNLSPVPSNGHGAIATPSIGAMSPPIGPPASVWLKELEGKVDGIRKVLVPRLADRCGQDGEGWYISVVIYAIWKGLLSLTSRSMPVPSALTNRYPAALVQTGLHAFAAEVNKRAPSPAQITSALKSVSVVGRARKATDAPTASGASTPSSIFQNAGFSTSTHSTSSTAALSKAVASQIHDMQAFERVMRKFAAGFTCQEKRQTTSSGQEDEDSSETDSDDEDELARAALTEALQAIRSTITVAHWLDVAPRAVLTAAGRKRGRTTRVSESCQLPVEVVHAAKAIPSLLLLHLVHARMPTNVGVFAIQLRKEGGSEPTVPSPHAAFGYTWTTYERAISGFAGGQTWATALAAAWREDIEEAWNELEERMQSKEVAATAITIKPGANFSLHRSPSVTSSEKEALDTTEAGQSQESLPSAQATVVDASDSTPTPASVMQQRSKVSPSISATASNDSLPEHMTQSAPTLNRDGDPDQPLALSSIRSASPSDMLPLPLTQGVQETGNGKDRPSWAFMRKISRKQSSSDTNSPPRQISPKASPPLTPNFSSAQDLRLGGGAQTPSRRFWRTPSSQNVAAAGTTAAGQHTTDGRPNTLHLPSLNPLRNNANSSNGTQSAVSDEERQRDETRLEAECLRLLTLALDAVEGLPQAQATPNQDVAVVAAAQ